MISSASRMTIARTHQLVSKSKAMLSTQHNPMLMQPMEAFEKSKIRNVRGCIGPNASMAINELKNESIKTFAEIEFKPASKLLKNCAAN